MYVNFNVSTIMQQLMWTLPNKHEYGAKTATVLNAKKVNTNGHVKKNTVRIQKDSNMLCYATAERSSNVTCYIAEEILVQEHSAFTSRAKKSCARDRANPPESS